MDSCSDVISVSGSSFFLRFRDQVLQPGGRAPGSVGGGSRRSGWGCNVEEGDNDMGFVSGGWEDEEVCNGVGGGRSGRSRLDVGTRLKGEAMAGNGLGGE